MRWLGRLDYRTAWDLQHKLIAQRAAGEVPDQLLLVEHEPVLTLGRQSNPGHIRATPDELAGLGIEVIRIERGGEVTYHGPGQLVAYPIVRLADRGLLIRPFVRGLEDAMAQTAADFGVTAGRREGLPGLWCDATSLHPRKLGALGLRIERGVSYHGIALNITTNLADFDLIDACGMPEAETTSIARELGWTGTDALPSTNSVARAADFFAQAFADRMPAPTATRVLVPA